jgi:hexosaminidase
MVSSSSLHSFTLVQLLIVTAFLLTIQVEARHSSSTSMGKERIRSGVPPLQYSPSRLWPLPTTIAPSSRTKHVSETLTCQWGALQVDTFARGCADGGAICTPSYLTQASAQAACEVDVLCASITSSPNASANWTLRASSVSSPSPSGEESMFLSNTFVCHPPQPAPGCAIVEPSQFAISFISGYVNDVTVAAAARYHGIFFALGNASAVGRFPGAIRLTGVNVTVTTNDDRLRFGIDESYSLSINNGIAEINAGTVFGAVWGLEAFSQLLHRTYATTEVGARVPGWYEICNINIINDSPRFTYRGVMIDTARHFLPIASIESVIDVLSALRLNALHIHFTDDDNWPLYIPTLSNITNVSAYSAQHVFWPDDLRAIVKYGRKRGVIVFPEIDLPAHSSTLRAAIPEMGCFIPNPPPATGGSRVLIDPSYPELLSTMRNIWRAMDAVFPKEYPFHMGCDEVAAWDWAACPNAIAWGHSVGCNVTANPVCVGIWFERSVFNIITKELGHPAMAWEDALVDSTWGVLSNLTLQQWNNAEWQSDSCTVLSTNASVLISGPYSLGEMVTLNYIDPFNLTCAPLTPRQQQQIVGGEYLVWGDAADTSASDLVVSVMMTLIGMSEAMWSTLDVILSGIDSTRYNDARCRLASRGISSNGRPLALTGTFCTPEAYFLPSIWNVDAAPRALDF